MTDAIRTNVLLSAGPTPQVTMARRVRSRVTTHCSCVRNRKSLVDVVELGQHGLGGHWRRHELQDDLIEHTQSALGAHHELGDIETRDTLYGLAAGFDVLALYVPESGLFSKSDSAQNRCAEI